MLDVLQGEQDLKVFLLFRVPKSDLSRVDSLTTCGNIKISALLLTLLWLAHRLLEKEDIWDVIRQSHQLCDDGGTMGHKGHSCLVAVRL